MAKKLVTIWLYTGIVLIFFMVLIGGVTRLTHSGLSIVEWDLLSEASLFPDDAEATELFDKYKQFPEYKLMNADFDLEDFKFILFWENLHRKWGRFIGMVFIVPYLIFTWKGLFSPTMHKKLLIILTLGAFQAFLGFFMVKSGLVDRPSVSHYRLAAHLITAFITCAYIYWTLLWYKREERIYQSAVDGKLHNWVNFTFILIIVQIILGGFVAGLKAGAAYNTFPKMGVHWFPSEIFAGNLIDTIPGVQFLHRYTAYLVAVMGVVLFYKVRKNIMSCSPEQKTAVNYLLIVIIGQFILGVITICYSVPLSMALLHQLGAFLLLLVITRIKFLHKFSVK